MRYCGSFLARNSRRRFAHECGRRPGTPVTMAVRMRDGLPPAAS